MPANHEGWQSQSDIVHLDPDGCPGLARMREAGRDPREQFMPVQMGARRLTSNASPCRLCAVEPLLVELLTEQEGDRTLFVTFTLGRAGADNRIERRRRSASDKDAEFRLELKEKARLRLLAVADAGRLSIAETVRGPVAFGFVSPSVRAELAATVRSEWRETVVAMPSPAVVASFWSLLPRDSTPAPTAGEDPWFVAEMIHDAAA